MISERNQMRNDLRKEANLSTDKRTLQSLSISSKYLTYSRHEEKYQILNHHIDHNSLVQSETKSK